MTVSYGLHQTSIASFGFKSRRGKEIRYKALKMNKKEILTFHFGIPSSDGNITTLESEQFTRKFLSELGVKVFSGCWGKIDLSSPKIEEFIDKVKFHQKKDNADFVGLSLLNQTITEPTEWYEIKSENNDFDSTTHKLYDDIKGYTIKAYKIPANINTLSLSGYNPIVSEKFVTLVRENNLTGIDFIWVNDNGKYKAKQWYIPIPNQPIGRGLDHSWFDPEKLKGTDWFQPKNQNWRTGVSNFTDKQINKKTHLPRITGEIIDLFDNHELIIHTNREYLREFLPETDFAFGWRQEDTTKEDYVLRERILCINRKTAKLLIKNNIIAKTDIEPIKIVDNITDGRAVLDTNRHYPSPFYTKNEFITLQKIVKKEFDEFKNLKKPKKTVKFKESLSLLRKVKKERPEDFNKGVKNLEKVIRDKFIPNQYQEILKITNGCNLDAECSFISKEEYCSFNQEKELILEELMPSFEKNISYIGYSIDGDWYAINNNESSEDYNNVYRISHEDLSIEYKWSNLGELIFDIIDGFYN